MIFCLGLFLYVLSAIAAGFADAQNSHPLKTSAYILWAVSVAAMSYSLILFAWKNFP